MALTQISTQGIKDGTITGTDLATNVDLIDNQKLRLGTGNDLQIYHSGTASFIDNTAVGHLFIRGNSVSNIYIRPKNGENSIVAVPNGAVELYHDSSKKFETTSSGVSITGSHNISGGYSVMHSGSSVLQLFSSLSSFACIKDFTDDLRIRSGKTTIMNEDQNETLAKFTANGSVELYYDNSKKFETYSDGLKFYGHQIGQTAGAYIQVAGASSNAFAIGMTSGSDLPSGTGTDLHFHHWNGSSWDKVFYANRDFVNIPDSKKIGFGDSNDLQIYHDGTHSRLNSATGMFNIQSDDFRVTDAANTLTAFKIDPDGATDLRHNGSVKLQTDSAGVIITGNLYQVDNDKLMLGNSSDLSIFHDGSNSYVRQNGTGDLILDAANGTADIRAKARNHIYMSVADSESAIEAFANGSVDLYHNGERKVNTHQNGLTIKNHAGGADTSLYVIGPEGHNAEIQMNADDGDDNADYFRMIHQANDNSWRLQNYAGGGWENSIRAYGNAQVDLYWNNVRKFNTEEVGANFYGRSVDCQLRLKTSDGTNRGHIYAYNDNSIAFLNAAGNYSFRANNDKTVTFFNHGLPNANNSYDLGSSSFRWANIYTNDLNLSNEGGSNDVDGTWGSYTIQEGAEDLFLVNKRNGKKYKFNLTEVS